MKAVRGRLDLAPAEHGFTARFAAMGSPCEVLCETSSQSEAQCIVEQVAAEAWRIEDKFSRYIDGNDVAQINTAQGQSVEVDDETADLLDFAAKLNALSDGGFDITSGALRRVWVFDGSDRLPSQDAVADALQHVGWSKVSWQRPRFKMGAEMEIDLGGIGKEYAVDGAVKILQQSTDIPCLVNFGGDLAVTGATREKRAWRVGIDSETSASADKIIALKQGALATSGDSRRFLLKDGIRYGHVLDPRSGWPVGGAAKSITVAADTCTQAGMLSTLAMLRGAEAEPFLLSQIERFWIRR